MRQTDEGGIIRPTGIFICERLYESVEPALLKEIFSPFPVEVFPQQCGTGCCSGPIFRNSATISAPVPEMMVIRFTPLCCALRTEDIISFGLLA